MKKIFLFILAIGISVFSDAHIGSPGVTFEGKAGAYAVMVLITPPDVIPGTATIDIYTKTSCIHQVVKSCLIDTELQYGFVLLLCKAGCSLKRFVGKAFIAIRPIVPPRLSSPENKD